MRLLASAALATFVPLLAVSAAGCLSDDDAGGAGSVDASVDASVPIGPFVDTGTPDHTLPDGSTDAGVDATTSDAGPDATPDVVVPPTDAGSATARLVNLVPDLGTAIDVCAGLPGGAFYGPVLGLAGVPAGLAYGEMSAYLTMPAHGIVRVVAAGGDDCSTPLVPDDADLGATDGSRVTVAFMGSAADAGAHGPSFHVYPDDDPTGFPATGTRIRIVHAAPTSAATDFVLGAGGITWPQHDALAYGAATSTKTMATGALATDANGYFSTAKSTEQVTATRGGKDVTSFVASIDHGVSAFFTGLEGSATTPPALVVCDDTASPTGFKVPCTTHTAPPTMTTFRFHHAASTVAAVDICLSLWGDTTQHGPLVAAAGVKAAGVAYKELSGELASVPTDTSFLFQYVAAGSACGQNVQLNGTAYLFGQPGVTDQTIVLAEGFDKAGAVNGFASDAVYTSFAAGTGGMLAFAFFDFDDSQNVRLSVFDTIAGVPEQTLLSNLYPLSGGTFATPIAAGNHTLRVAMQDVTADAGATTTYTGAGMQFGAGSRWMMSYVETQTAKFTMIRCDLTPPAAGSNRACLE